MDAIGFDVYGTLVDPMSLQEEVARVAGPRAAEVTSTWRSKQVEYAFRRAAMGQWEPFEVCTAQALEHAMASAGIALSPEARDDLIDRYLRLPPFADVAGGLEALRRAGFDLFAFSNGSAEPVRTLLGNAGLLDHFRDVVSVAEVQVFKPHPAVYRHLASRAGRAPGHVWLVSSNAWDIAGARAVGLHTAWVRRSPQALFDPWGGPPEVEVRDLGELARRLMVQSRTP